MTDFEIAVAQVSSVRGAITRNIDTHASVGTFESIGKSAIWTPDGRLLAQTENTESALVIATNNHATWRGEVVRI